MFYENCALHSHRTIGLLWVDTKLALKSVPFSGRLNGAENGTHLLLHRTDI